MKNQSDQETFLGLKSRDSHAYEILYKFYYPSVKHFIIKNNGTVDDAKDIFQETIFVLLQKVPKDDFNLTSSLKTYIFAISSNLWLKRLRYSSKIVKADPAIYEKYLADYEEAETNIHDSKTIQAQNIFKRITDKCITLLKAIFYDKKDIDIVTKEFGYTNKHNTQNQKYKCLEQARRGADQFL